MRKAKKQAEVPEIAQESPAQQTPSIGHSVPIPQSIKGRPVKYEFSKMNVNDHIWVEGRTSLQMWSSINNFLDKWQPKWKFACKNNQPDPDGKSTGTGVLVWRIK